MAAGGAPSPPVGFLGLGTMGAPMASRLLAAGLPLVVHNRDRAKAEPILAAGATWAASPRELGRAVRGGIVFVMVTDGRAVRSVLFGRQGLSAGAPSGTLVVNLSTIGPDESRDAAERLARRGVRYLEAPVGGSRDAAERGELLIFVGGEAADLAVARPLLDRLGRAVEHLGPVGFGAAMKLVNNLVMVSTLAIDAEALALAEALGVPPPRAVELLLAGAGESRVLRAKQEALLHRDYPVRFKLSLARKDLRLAGKAARAAGLYAPISHEAQRLADQAIGAGLGEQDLSAMYESARGRRRGPPPAPAPGG